MSSKQLDEKGFLLPIITKLFTLSHNLTVLGWIECIRKRKTSRIGAEVYTLVWLAILLIAIFILNCSIPQWLSYFFVIFAFSRLFDIVVTVIHLSFFRDDTPKYPARSLILIALDYIAIILIFSITGFVLSSNFATTYDSFQFSADVFVPLISINSNHLPVEYWLFILEVATSLIIHITIIQRILSYFAQNVRLMAKFR